jgi:hypothetical protein
MISKRLSPSIYNNHASSPSLEPTQPPIQWVPGALSLGVRRSEREADYSFSYSAKLEECVELYLHFPYTPLWRGAQTIEVIELSRVVFRSYSVRISTGDSDIMAEVFRAFPVSPRESWNSRHYFSIPDGGWVFHNSVQNCSGTHPSSYPMGTGGRGSFPGCKAAGAWNRPLNSI